MENKEEYIKDRLREIINIYNSVIDNIDDKSRAVSNHGQNSSGGFLRARKGQLCPTITKELILLAWESLGQDKDSIHFNAKTIKYPIDLSYVHSIKSRKVQQKIKDNLSKFQYRLPPDVLIYLEIDEAPIAYIECKAYTETAMLKRVLFDCSVAKKVHPDITCFLFQLESQLGGDYSALKKEVETVGSYPSRTLFSVVPEVDLKIFTFLEGDRQVNKAIHKKEFKKELTEESLLRGLELLTEFLKKHIKEDKSDEE